jgi:hypothetical protein
MACAVGVSVWDGAGTGLGVRPGPAFGVGNGHGDGRCEEVINIPGSEAQ